MNAPRASLFACLVRAVSAPMLVAVGAIVMCAAVVLDLGGVLGRADLVGLRVDRARADIAAETVLARVALGRRPGGRANVAGVSLDVQRDGDDVYVTPLGRFGGERFVARMLPGDAPPALSRSRGAVTEAGRRALGDAAQLPPAGWPRLDERALDAARHGAHGFGLRRDRGVALQFLAAGTDRDDYVWEPPAPQITTGGLVVVPGHLWLPPAAAPLRVELDADVVVVVEGNLYLHRSVEVSGAGRLLFATRELPDEGAVAFVDRDGDGARAADEVGFRPPPAAGAVEGCGNVYAFAAGAVTLRLDAGLIVAGELHLGAPFVVVGPLLLRRGATALAAEALLLPPPADAWVFAVGRELVPGFLVGGVPRPGRREIVRGEPLYPGPAGR